MRNHVTLLILTISLLLVACGDSGGSGGNSKKSPSPEEERSPIREGDGEDSTTTGTSGDTYTPPADTDSGQDVDEIVDLVEVAALDALISARLDVIRSWDLWDNFQELISSGDYRLQWFYNATPADDVYSWFHGNGTAAEWSQYEDYVDYNLKSRHTGLTTHCDESVEKSGSRLTVNFVNGKSADLEILIYTYWPSGASGPGHITYVKIRWKLSTDTAFQEEVREADCI
jgi:hypothetical protein